MVLCATVICITVSHSTSGNDQSPIKIGITTALTGPAQELGSEVKEGIELYFNKINESGGVNGRKVELIALDDKYEPALAAPNMRKLIDDHKVLAVIGNLGTPTAVVTVPIANEKQVLLFGAVTGSALLRKNPPDRYVINFRASYAKEMECMIKGLLSAGIKPEEIAFFTQNDAYGDSGYKGAVEALKVSGYSAANSLPYGRYARNTLNVEEGLARILRAQTSVKAIIIVGAYAPVAKFIKLAKNEYPEAIYLNVSFVGADPLLKTLGEDEKDVIITQIIPSVNEDLPAIREFREDIEKYSKGKRQSYGLLEGYLAAKLFTVGLRKAAEENDVTREGIIDALESLGNADIGIDVPVGFSKTDHDALGKIWPTIIKNKRFEPLIWTELRTKNPDTKTSKLSELK